MSKGGGIVKIHRSGELSLEGSVIAIGAFDGIHKGHQKVISRTVAQAKMLDVPSIIYTFDPPPRAYFQQARILSELGKKMNRLQMLGIDHTVIAAFNEAYLNRTPASFIEELAKMNPLHIIVGEDFRFGHKRAGDILLLKKHFQVETINPVCCAKGKRISSTRIRELMSEGKVEQAIPLLN